MVTAVVGINWGDEGKGRMVDLLSKDFDLVCRYQGGNNAGHTIVNDNGKFVLHLLPSGILHNRTVNLLGAGMVIDLVKLWEEIEQLIERGIKISPDNLKISGKALVVLPFHVQQDCLEEERLADRKYGSTRRGIAPCYADKFMKKGIRIYDLLDVATLKNKISDIVEWKNLTLKSYGEENKAEVEETVNLLLTYAPKILPFVVDAGQFLTNQIKAGKRIMFEGQLGALRDIDYGIYPFTTSSNTLASYAPIGSGLPSLKIDQVLGIMKAFSTCVGEGPFAVEMSGEEARLLREAGGEYGAATGRPRRVGAFDVVASRYGVFVQGATEIALTKLDILSYMDEIPVCVAYEIDGERVEQFPFGDRLLRAKPVFEYLPGFKKDISNVKKAEELPKQALDYIQYLETAVGVKIKYVSVGAGREQFIQMEQRS